MLYENSLKARQSASQTLAKVKDAIGLNYFKDEDFIKSQANKFNENK